MPLPPFETHVVQNQPPPFMGRDLLRVDGVPREAVLREGAAAFVEGLAAYGALAGGELYQLGFEANRQRPQLRTHDAQGNRLDSVDFHPAYHRLMHHGKAQGVAGLFWQSAQPGAHVARADAYGTGAGAALRRHRRSFGKRLVEHPLMTNVLAALALESEAATTFALRVAHAVDAAELDPR